MDEANRKLDSHKFEIGEQESEVSDMRKRNDFLTQKMNIARTKFAKKNQKLTILRTKSRNYNEMLVSRKQHDNLLRKKQPT